MNFVLNLLIKLLNILEVFRDWIYEKTGRWAEIREIVTNFLNDLETNFKKFSPFTLIIGFMIFFFVLRFLIKKIKKTWNHLSKIF